MTIVAVVVVRVDVARIEIEVSRVVRVTSVERARPVVAVRAIVVERTIVAVPCGGQKNASSCFGSHLIEMLNGTSYPYIGRRA